MAADYVSFQRARGVSLIGLGLQLAFGLVLLLYSLFGDDRYAFPVAVVVLIGTPIWVSLALVFHQHVLERRESEEAAAFRDSEAAAASVFESSADMQVQANRLQWMHRYLLPAVSLVLGGLHVGVGVWLYRSGAGQEGLDEPSLGGLALAIGAIGGVVSFIFARYTAGMAKERTWLLLNGGAGAAVGMTLLGGALSLGVFLVNTTAAAWLLVHLPEIVGIYAMVIGAEMFLNFVLNLYRPRSAGEYLRPAFDSRILAYIAAPDRLAQSISDAINYQFGFSVSSTWFYRLLSRWVVVLLLVLVALTWAMTSVAVLGPHERGILLRNGANGGVVEPGPVVKAPWPISRVEAFPATALNALDVGSLALTEENRDTALLWSEDDRPGELMFVVQPSEGRAREGARAVQTLSLAPMVVNVTYLIDDVERYYMLAQDGPAEDRDAVRRELLTSLASSEAIAFLGGVPFNRVIAGLSGEATNVLRERIGERFGRAEAGVRVTSVSLIGASPPKGAADAFEEAVASVNARATTIQSAQSQADGTLAGVAGSAANARRIVRDLDRLSELESELRALESEGSAGVGEDGERREALRERIAELEAELTRSMIEGGGQASAILSQARSDRRVRALEARAEVLRRRGELALYDAAPNVYRTSQLMQALVRTARGSRVWIVPPAVRYELEQLEVIQTLDIRPAGDEEN